MPKAYALLAGSGVGTPAVRTFLDLDSTADGGALCDVRCRALDHIHPLSVLRDDDGHHERRRGDYFERREVDFLL